MVWATNDGNYTRHVNKPKTGRLDPKKNNFHCKN